MIESLRPIRVRQARTLVGNTVPSPLSELSGYLKSLLSPSGQSLGLIEGLDRFSKMSQEDQQEALASTYLMVEEFLVELDPRKRFLREQLREIIRTRFGSLLSLDPRFELIFHDADRQEILLCREFLLNIIDSFRRGEGGQRLDMLQPVRRWLIAIPRRSDVPLPFGVKREAPADQENWLDALRKVSIELYRFLGETAGEGAASLLYRSSYEKLMDMFITLETFPVVISLFPEGLMDREKRALLRIGTIRRTLSEKSEQLHEITEQLLAKNNELAAIRKELNKAKEDLERRVSERTAELESMNRQLRDEVNERRSAEEALKASQEYARSIIESSLDMIVAVDKDRNIIEFNKAAESAFGFRREEVLGKHVSILYADPDSSRDLSSVLHDEEGIVREIMNRRKNGEVFPSVLSASVLRDAKGNVIGSMGVSRDITKAKEAEEVLRRTEERYRLLFEESKDVVFMCDAHGQFVEVNPAGVELFGFQKKQELLQGNTLETVFQDPVEGKAFFEMLRMRMVIKDHEVSMKRASGTRITVSVTANAVVDTSGTVYGFRGIMRDITERRQLERQLLQSQKLESIGLLAGGIAHDINNVLTPILIAVDTFRCGVSNEEQKELLEMMEISARRGADIVKQILTIARRVEGERMEIDLRHLVKEMMKVISETFPKTIKVTMDAPKQLWNVLGDPSQLHQILLNLTVNARDAMPDGGTLTMALDNIQVDEQYARMKVDAVPGPYVSMSVSDTGNGIPRDLLDKIFEPFFTTKGPGKGTGLGLSTVHSIVKNHRGFLDVTSDVGRGTTFSVFLPAAVSGTLREAAMNERRAPKGHGECILIVDDEASIREVTTMTLTRHGYKAIAATDGTEAVAFYVQRKPAFDLVITDLSMAVMDGYETIQALERIDPDVKIIAASGHSSGDDIQRPLGKSVKSVLQKPYSAEKLLASVYSVLHAEESSKASS